jgi:hypothetical protein
MPVAEIVIEFFHQFCEEVYIGILVQELKIIAFSFARKSLKVYLVNILLNYAVQVILSKNRSNPNLIFLLFCNKLAVKYIGILVKFNAI